MLKSLRFTKTASSKPTIHEIGAFNMKARYRARSRMKIASMLGIIWAFSFSVRLLAQDTPQPVIGGFQVHCADAEGDVVVTRFVSQGSDIAWSTIQPFPPEPLIFINLPKARQLPQLLQLFAYAHECGHHVSGDVIRGVILKENVPDREKTADRIGIRLLRDQFRIKPNQADVIAHSSKIIRHFQAICLGQSEPNGFETVIQQAMTRARRARIRLQPPSQILEAHLRANLRLSPREFTQSKILPKTIRMMSHTLPAILSLALMADN